MQYIFIIVLIIPLLFSFKSRNLSRLITIIMSAENKEVHVPMILKMERICRGYIDQLEKGGKHFNIQNFMMMYIFGSTNNTEYRTKLFDHWPTYLEDFAACKEIMGYRYPETLCDNFLTLNLDKEAKIIDVACGAGNIAYIVR